MAKCTWYVLGQSNCGEPIHRDPMSNMRNIAWFMHIMPRTGSSTTQMVSCTAASYSTTLTDGSTHNIGLTHNVPFRNSRSHGQIVLPGERCKHSGYPFLGWSSLQATYSFTASGLGQQITNGCRGMKCISPQWGALLSQHLLS